MPLLIDGHLDLAYNVTAARRDLTLELEILRKRERKRKTEVALVTLPELQRGGVGIVFATLFAMPKDALRPPGARPPSARQREKRYGTPEEARALAVEQLELYERWEEEGRLRILRSKGDLEAQLEALAQGDSTVGLVILLEGADPLRTPDDLAWWLGRGLRLLGLAWQRTRYCGGTMTPGPLSELGVELVQAMKEAGLPLDVSHLAEESFWGALELGPQVLASHSNARALTPSDRHLSDEMIRAIGAREGVIGLVLGNPFVKGGITRKDPKESVTLADVRAQAEHVAGLIGWDKVAIGSDFDGGFGVQETPLEITRGADFIRLGEVAPREARAGPLGENWLHFLRRVLPS
jgi:membrane dipeptidase